MLRRWAVRGLLGACAVVVAIDGVVVAQRSPAPPPLDAEAAAQWRASFDPWPVMEPAPAPAAAVVAAPAPAPTTTVPPPPPPPAPVRAGAWTLGPYQGLGVWLDVYDWTNEITGGRPSVGLESIDQMASVGIETLFIQTSHRRSAADVIEPDRLQGIIDRAHQHGMAVVAWYLPTLVDVPTDLRRLVAASQLDVDGVGVDIEALDVADPTERTRRLLALSTALREAIGPKAMSAITPSAVHLQVVNPGFWPAFPWPELAATYDVIVPMSYWSVRRPEWKQGERYTAENLDRIRASTGRPDVPIHIAGGIANGITLDDVAGMVRAIQGRSALGGSLYDWSTSQVAQWDLLQVLRAAAVPG
jgi:hypothetical protein